jgi:hypothetical protein
VQRVEESVTTQVAPSTATDDEVVENRASRFAAQPAEPPPMAAIPVQQFPCPGCGSFLSAPDRGRIRCPNCSWSGEIYGFSPAPLDVRSAELALPNDATCIHHPTKKAVAVCAGTGDYICSLCAVQLDGETYSADYLSAAGKEKANKAFLRTLPRPDGRARLYLLLPFIPYVNLAAIPFAFIWLPHGFVLCGRCARLRRQDPLFARLIGPARLVVLRVLLGIYSLLWLIGVAALVIAWMVHHS